MHNSAKVGIVSRVRLPITDLRLNEQAKFETRAAARNEDMIRRRLLFRVSENAADRRAAAALSLERRLAPPKAMGQLSDTLSSSRSMRRLRRFFCGSVIDLLKAFPAGSVSFYTVICADWQVGDVDLAAFEPKKILERFRAQLNRRGLAALSGWLIASVHGDYDPATRRYQVHIHLVAVGDARNAIESLREMPCYRPGVISRPILRRRAADLERMTPYYLAQSFWPMKKRLPNGRRDRRRYRLPPNELVDWLLWIDQQSFGDLVWMHRCHVSGGKIVPDG